MAKGSDINKRVPAACSAFYRPAGRRVDRGDFPMDFHRHFIKKP